MSDGPDIPDGGDQSTGDPEADVGEAGPTRDAVAAHDVQPAPVGGEATEADRAEALARATIARAEAARRATAARAEALRRISDQHVESVRTAESDRQTAVRRAQERYEDELRAAEQRARHEIESACEESTTALDAAYAAMVRAGETAMATVGSRDAAVEHAESQRSETHGRASEERTRSVVAAHLAHSEALELADDTRSHELEGLRAVEEELFGDTDG